MGTANRSRLVYIHVFIYNLIDHLSQPPPFPLCSPQMLSSQVPCLMSYLSDPALSDPVLSMLVDVSQASPSSLTAFLPQLKGLGQQQSALLGHVAKIHGAVGMTSEVGTWEDSPCLSPSNLQA